MRIPNLPRPRLNVADFAIPRLRPRKPPRPILAEAPAKVMHLRPRIEDNPGSANRATPAITDLKWENKA